MTSLGYERDLEVHRNYIEAHGRLPEGVLKMAANRSKASQFFQAMDKANKTNKPITDFKPFVDESPGPYAADLLRASQMVAGCCNDNIKVANFVFSAIAGQTPNPLSLKSSRLKSS